MNATNGTIVVVNRAQKEAENLKELIQFMDAPEVCTATPADWREAVGDRRLDAIFIGADLSDGEVRELLGDMADSDPNVPIVVLNEAANQ